MIQTKMQALQAWLAVRKMALQTAVARRDFTAKGGVSVSTILWIVLGVIIVVGAILWWTVGGGSTAVTNLLKDFTTQVNSAGGTTAL